MGSLGRYAAAFACACVVSNAGAVKSAPPTHLFGIGIMGGNSTVQINQVADINIATGAVTYGKQFGNAANMFGCNFAFGYMNISGAAGSRTTSWASASAGEHESAATSSAVYFVPDGSELTPPGPDGWTYKLMTVDAATGDVLRTVNLTTNYNFPFVGYDGPQTPTSSSSSNSGTSAGTGAEGFRSGLVWGSGDEPPPAYGFSDVAGMDPVTGDVVVGVHNVSIPTELMCLSAVAPAPPAPSTAAAIAGQGRSGAAVRDALTVAAGETIQTIYFVSSLDNDTCPDRQCPSAVIGFQPSTGYLYTVYTTLDIVNMVAPWVNGSLLVMALNNTMGSDGEWKLKVVYPASASAAANAPSHVAVRGGEQVDANTEHDDGAHVAYTSDGTKTSAALLSRFPPLRADQGNWAAQLLHSFNNSYNAVQAVMTTHIEEDGGDGSAASGHVYCSMLWEPADQRHLFSIQIGQQPSGIVTSQLREGGQDVAGASGADVSGGAGPVWKVSNISFAILDDSRAFYGIGNIAPVLQ